ncbi:hypothetical protein BDV12DRAFT_198653 [Aspergillus spectabilis]
MNSSQANTEGDPYHGPESESEATAQIDEWYNAGKPLFTREAMVSIRDQLRAGVVRGDQILAKGLDGEVYKYNVHTGKVREHHPYEFDENGLGREDKTREKERWIFDPPLIRYNAYSHLKQDLSWNLEKAYVSMGVVHYMTLLKDEPPDALPDVEVGLDSFNATLEQWERGEAWGEIKSTLLSLELRGKITNIIGMASGRFTAAHNERASRRSTIQNGFLVLLKKTLEESHLGTDNVPCFAQDPAYSLNDREILSRSGLDVVDDPDGFLHTDDTSLVFSCAPNICVKEVITDISRPLILIWCEVGDEPRKESCTDPDSPRVIEMIKTEYDKLPFPKDDGDDFSSMAIYVKKAARVTHLN